MMGLEGFFSPSEKPIRIWHLKCFHERRIIFVQLLKLEISATYHGTLTNASIDKHAAKPCCTSPRTDSNSMTPQKYAILSFVWTQVYEMLRGKKASDISITQRSINSRDEVPNLLFRP